MLPAVAFAPVAQSLLRALQVGSSKTVGLWVEKQKLREMMIMMMRMMLMTTMVMMMHCQDSTRFVNSDFCDFSNDIAVWNLGVIFEAEKAHSSNRFA